MLKYVLLILVLACSGNTDPPPLDRASFENAWWGTEKFSLCFNFHESGNVLIYEYQIRDEGPWQFYDPNKYIFAGSTETITVEQNEECWKITGYSRKNSFIACECLERETVIPAVKQKSP